MEKKVTNIDDVAQAASVSTKTVSRVINNEPNVREKTKTRVLEAIKELGYKPSFSARSLASKRNYCLNLLCRTPKSDYFNSIQFGALNACQAHGYHLFVSLIEDYMDLSPADLRSRLENLVLQPRADAIIIPPPFCDDHLILETLEAEQVPFVRISPFKHDHDSPFVAFNEEEAAYDLTKYLIELGHRRIGFIKGNPTHGSATARQKGYERALKEAGIEIDAAIMLTGDFHFLSGLNAGLTLCGLADRPTAIFASNDEMAAGVSVAAHRCGLSIPEDISIAGFDDTAVAELTWPSLTTIRQPMDEMAQAAALLAINPNTDGLKEEAQELKHSLIIRESTAPPK